MRWWGWGLGLAVVVVSGALALRRSAPPPGPRADAPWIAAGLPPFSARLQAINTSYYQIAFTADRFPATWNYAMSNVPGGRGAAPLINPIVGTYVIRDYLDELERTHDQAFLDGAIVVARAALARMRPHQDALVFFYDPPLARTPFYSALTQAQYLDAFQRIATLSRDPTFAGAAARVARGLAIPMDEGGVAFDVGEGTVLAEYPGSADRPPMFVLNGWLTTLRSLSEYWARCDCKTSADEVLEQRNLEALRRLLPLYDSPGLANSLYRLTDSVPVRIEFSAPGVEITGGTLSSDSLGRYRIHAAGRSPPADKSALTRVAGTAQGPSTWTGQLWLSYVPVQTRVELEVRAPAPAHYRIELRNRRYRPQGPALDETTPWRVVAEGELRASTTTIAVVLRRGDLRRSMPLETPFKAIAAAGAVNVYHYLAINELYGLYGRTGESVAKAFADRWVDYPARWKDNPVYQGVDPRDYYSAQGLEQEYGFLEEREALPDSELDRLASVLDDVARHWTRLGPGLVPREVNQNLDQLLALPEANCAQQSYLFSRRAIELGYQTRRRGLFATYPGLDANQQPNDLVVEVWVDDAWRTFIPSLGVFSVVGVDRLERDPNLVASTFGDAVRPGAYATPKFFSQITKDVRIANENAFERDVLADAVEHRCTRDEGGAQVCVARWAKPLPLYRVWLGRLDPATVGFAEVRAEVDGVQRTLGRVELPGDLVEDGELDIGFSTVELSALEIEIRGPSTFELRVY